MAGYNDRQLRVKKEAEESARLITDFVNHCGVSERKYFIIAMSSAHRVLQGYFTELCLAWLHYLSTLKADEYDSRNKYAVDIAKNIRDAMNKQTESSYAWESFNLLEKRKVI